MELDSNREKIICKVFSQVDKSLPKIKHMLCEKDPSVYEVTVACSSNQERTCAYLDIIIIFFDFPADFERTKEELRCTICQDCKEMIDEAIAPEYAGIPISFEVSFSTKSRLDKGAGGDLQELAFSDWDHGSLLS